ncbi:signal peptidase I [Thiomicrospira sp. WB1]|uniref:signal peptidase I n=1 Tax=Thiomicrospira sp. WB1 TaxID=1685380 RepID=UPI000746A3B8|nr:signal peptidase I [Thiomicrospira sp. WB1]KUJ71883.1 S26 family signal peptidase [Thiomicrospira sp. WB1]
MSFELILVIVTAITGVIVYVDKTVWAPKRARSVTGEKQPVLVEYARSLFPVFLIVLVLRSFVIEPFRIPSGSMYPTLQIGDFIVVNKFAYGIKLPVTQTKLIDTGEPERGDVAVFKYPKDPNVDYIKRIVGLPGDEISYIERTLFINGQPAMQQALGEYDGEGAGNIMDGTALIQESLDERTHRILLDHQKSSQDLVSVTVPEGHYFVMGDNRDHSNDSRFWGFVPEKNLKGEAFGIWMHWDDGIDFGRIGKGID